MISPNPTAWGLAKAAPKLCARDLVTEAIRLARQNKPRADITGSSRQASTSEVRDWAASSGQQRAGTQG